MATKFSEVYNHFLGKITDDMYMELTPEDTVRDLQKMLVNSIPGFEFPRKNLLDYTIDTKIKYEDELNPSDFVLGLLWNEMEEEDGDEDAPPKVIVDDSSFAADLTLEEIDILSILMMGAWLQRQITSIENTRMKYSGSDFKMTSQANHLAKLLSLQSKVDQQSLHMQRLYKRRRFAADGRYESNWSIFRHNSALDY